MNPLDNDRWTPKKILVCQQRQIGDVLLAEPVLALLQARYPQAEVHLFTETKCEPLLRHNPAISRFHLIDKHVQNHFFRQLAWYTDVAAWRFDLLVDLQQLPRCRMMARMSRAPVRLSFPAPWYRPLLYTHTVPMEPGYASARKVSLLRPLGIEWQGQAPRIYLQDEEQRAADALLSAAGLKEEHSLVTVDATHRRQSKRWPVESYARTMELLAQVRPDLRFLLLYGPGEEAEIQALKALCHRPETILSPQAEPELRRSAAYIRRAALHIGNCSSPRHIAVAMDTPSLVIPGASGTDWAYPSPRHGELRPQLVCQPCHKTTCDRPLCLTLVTPEAVMRRALEVLSTYPAPFGATFRSKV